MSKEIQIGFPCTHYIMEEPVELAEDRRTIISGSPVGSKPSVRVLVNNQYYIPSTGLYTQAFLTSAKKGPYRIEKCVGLLGPDANLLIVETPAGKFEVRLPESKRMSLVDLQKSLRLSVLNSYVEITAQNGAIAFKEKQNLGKDSWIRLSGKGAETLGFSQKGSRGCLLYPGWDLVKEETIIPSTNPRLATKRKVVFRSPVKGSPELKLSYTTLPSLCKRCRATFVENDYRFNPLGEVLTIENENLLLQACLKVILTNRGSNPFHVSYGSKIQTRIGNKIVGASEALIKEDIVRALQIVKSLQRQQRQFQTVKSKELLVSISSVDVTTDENDPTLYYVDVIVRNGSNEPVNISITYTAPGAVALTGSNGQSLGTERVGL